MTFATLALLAVGPAAPLPPEGRPRVEVTIEHVIRPPMRNLFVCGNARGRGAFIIDDGGTVKVTVRNRTDRALTVVGPMPLYQAVYVRAVDAGGTEVTRRAALLALAPNTPPGVWGLAANETYEGTHHVCDQLVAAGRKPGTYTVRVVFEADGVKAESDDLVVTVQE